MKDRLKVGVRYMWMLMAAAAVIVVFRIFSTGMYLSDIPRASEVVRVTISYPEKSSEALVLEDSEDIVEAVRLAGYLFYRPFSHGDADFEPVITIVYDLDTGESVEVAADGENVLYRGNVRVLTKKNTFVTKTGEVFFPEN